MNAVDIENLNFSYNDTLVFNDLSLSIDEKSITTILGKGSIGKSTLFKILCGDLKYDGNILVLNKSIKYNLEKGYLGFISTDSYSFKKRIVKDEILYCLENKGIAFSKIDAELKRISKKVCLQNILDFKISDLNVKEKNLLMVAIQIINKPKIIIIDNVFDYLDNEKKTIWKELIRLNRKGTTIVNITQNPEECLFGKDIIILNDSVLYFKTKDILEEDFLNNDLDVPFIISLSNKLKFYNLLDKNYLDIDKLVDVLWQ